MGLPVYDALTLGRCGPRLVTAPNSVVPPAEDSTTAPRENSGVEPPKEPTTTAIPPADDAAPKEKTGEEPAAGLSALSSGPGPVIGDKVQEAMSKITPSKPDDTAENKDTTADKEGTKTVDEKELKEKSPIGGAATAPIEGKTKTPPPAPTVEDVTQGKEAEASGGSKPEAEKPEEKEEKPKEQEAPETNGPGEKKDESADTDTQAGEKRAAVNGGSAGPVKKAKTEAAPTTNGGGAKASKGKREKKPAAVGKTERRTRSQGLAS